MNLHDGHSKDPWGEGNAKHDGVHAVRAPLQRRPDRHEEILGRKSTGDADVHETRPQRPYPGQWEEDQIADEKAVIFLPHTVSREGTVMVHAIDALIANGAVLRTHRAHDQTRGAELGDVEVIFLGQLHHGFQFVLFRLVHEPRITQPTVVKYRKM